MAKKPPIITHRCGDCAYVTPVLDQHHLLDLKGNPTLGTCPFWTESRCTLLSWESECKHFKQKNKMTQQEINKMFEGRWRIKGFDSYEVRQLSGQTVQSLCRDFFQAGILLAAKEATVPDGSSSGITTVPAGSPSGITTVPDGSSSGITTVPDGSSSGLATVPDGSSSGKPQKHPLALRAESFYQQVHAPEFTAKYPPQLLQDFFSYWSEPNRSKTKMRFELQKTWDTSRRLATWARNDFHHYANTQPTIDQQRADKLASILTD